MKIHTKTFSPLNFIRALMDNTASSYRTRGEACETELGLRASAGMRTLAMSCGRGRGSQEWIGSHKGSYKVRPPDMPVPVHVVISLGTSTPYGDKMRILCQDICTTLFGLSGHQNQEPRKLLFSISC